MFNQTYGIHQPIIYHLSDLSNTLLAAPSNTYGVKMSSSKITHIPPEQTSKRFKPPAPTVDLEKPVAATSRS